MITLSPDISRRAVKVKEPIHSGAPPPHLMEANCHDSEYLCVFSRPSNTMGSSVSEAGLLQVAGNYLREWSHVAGIAVTHSGFMGPSVYLICYRTVETLPFY